jgi:hypothetical protein
VVDVVAEGGELWRFDADAAVDHAALHRRVGDAHIKPLRKQPLMPHLVHRVRQQVIGADDGSVGVVGALASDDRYVAAALACFADQRDKVADSKSRNNSASRHTPPYQDYIAA